MKHATLMELQQIKSAKAKATTPELIVPKLEPVTDFPDGSPKLTEAPPQELVTQPPSEPPSLEEPVVTATPTNMAEPVTSTEPKGEESESASLGGNKQKRADMPSLEDLFVDVEWVIAAMEGASKDLDIIRVKVSDFKGSV